MRSVRCKTPLRFRPSLSGFWPGVRYDSLPPIGDDETRGRPGGLEHVGRRDAGGGEEIEHLRHFGEVDLGLRRRGTFEAERREHGDDAEQAAMTAHHRAPPAGTISGIGGLGRSRQAGTGGIGSRRGAQELPTRRMRWRNGPSAGPTAPTKARRRLVIIFMLSLTCGFQRSSPATSAGRARELRTAAPPLGLGRRA